MRRRRLRPLLRDLLRRQLLKLLAGAPRRLRRQLSLWIAELAWPEGPSPHRALAAQAGASLRVCAVDAETGAPLPRGRVQLEREGDCTVDGCGPDGVCTLTALRPGDYTVTVRADSRLATTRQVSLGAGAHADLGQVALARWQAGPGEAGLSYGWSGEDVIVEWVLERGPAQTAGLRAGDIVRALNGIPVPNPEDAARRSQGAPGTRLTLTLRRGEDWRVVDIMRAGETN